MDLNIKKMLISQSKNTKPETLAYLCANVALDAIVIASLIALLLATFYVEVCVK